MSKPEVTVEPGPVPTDLVVDDLVTGEGPEAGPGSTVEVHYVGVEHDTGAEFDSSSNRGQSIRFPLGSRLGGWQEGIPGRKEGGRRQPVCPPDWAYGPAGSGHPLAGKTLVFVIDRLGTD